MKALRLDLFQETACYRKPFAIKISETYPLPPYSTINGLLHRILDAKEYIPMRISIQGDYESLVNEYQTTYFYKKNYCYKNANESAFTFKCKINSSYKCRRFGTR